jgi:aminoglycoside phosphotransferase (APT) family kinase protein
VSASDRFSGTGPVREQHRFNQGALEKWLFENVDGFCGPLIVEQFKGGQSNPTYRLRTAGRDYVLRRKPPGALLKGAHAVERESRVMSALALADFPVPTVYANCEDSSVIGSGFFVMEMIEGRVFWEPGFVSVPVDDRAEYMNVMNETLAKLHTVDYAAIGLADFGKPGRYVARQVERWSAQYLADEAAGRNQYMDALVRWLPEHLPPRDETALIHGDFRADNLIFHPTEAKVLAVLDWELSTLGDPVADFAYHAMMYRLPPDILGGIFGVSHEGLPSEVDYISAYCNRVGRHTMPDFDYYVVFNMFRFAAILHGIRARVARGTAASDDARATGDRFARVAQLAWEQAEKVDRRER